MAPLSGAAVAVCPGSTDVPSPGNLSEVATATLCLVNAVRTRYGLTPLVDNPTLHAAARSHAQDMVTSDYFEHTTPAGVTQLDRIRASGYLDGASEWTVGENIAYGTRQLATPLATVIAWFWSPTHRVNILSPEYRESGIGVVAATPPSLTTDYPAATYTQEFGVVTR